MDKYWSIKEATTRPQTQAELMTRIKQYC